MNDVAANTKDTSYLNNPKLKKAGVQLNYTEEQIKEYLKCANDPIYFIKNYMTIVHVDKGVVPFDMWEFQEKMVRTFHENRFSIAKLPRQVGKALSLDEDILTNKGFIKFGDIKVGDVVYGPDGKETNVTFVTPVMYGHKCYNITFDDGTVITADAEHLWKVDSSWWNKSKIINTEELVDVLKSHKKNGAGLSIEMNDALVFREGKKLPIDPYTLGVWLGDGNKNDGRINCHKDDLYCYEKNIPYEISESSYDNRNNNVLRFNVVGLHKKLRCSGIKGNKHIPDEYKFSSIDERLELIRGLMDTDGSIRKNSGMEFYQKDESLIDDFIFILRSLGIKTRKSTKIVDDTIYYTVRFATDKYNIFNLDRKLEKQNNHTYGPKNRKIYIHKIEETKSVPVKCIQVDNEDHMFLIGKNLIPTHNTTTVVGFLLWSVLFNESYNVAILANKLTMSREILSRLQMGYENLPLWLQQGVVEWNKGSIELENGSKILASATSSSAVRGGSYNCIYLDEFAFVPKSIQEEFYTSVYPTISSGKTTKLIITSTPNGLDLFYKLWVDSEEDRNSFKRIECHWSDVPGRDEKWREETIKNTSELQFEQEYETSFLGSAHTLISGTKLRTLAYNEPLQHTQEGYKYFEMPDKNRKYIMIVDTAHGTGLDYSAFIVLDVTEAPYKVVCTFRNNTVHPIIYPKYIIETAMRYNNCQVLVEVNDLGQQVVDIILNELEYDGLISTFSRTKKTVATVGFGVKSTVGIRTTRAVKRVGCSTLKGLIENDKLIISDYEILSELSRFSLKNNSYEAESGNDDLVMCCVLFAWFTTQTYFRDLTDTNIVKDIFSENTDRFEDELVPFGLIQDGQEEDYEILDGDIWRMG